MVVVAYHNCAHRKGKIPIWKYFQLGVLNGHLRFAQKIDTIRTLCTSYVADSQANQRVMQLWAS